MARGSISRWGNFFFFPQTSKPALGHLLPPPQWVSLRLERSGREADCLPPSSAEVTNGRSYASPKCSDGVHRDCMLFYRAAEFPSVCKCDMRASDLKKQQQLQEFGAFEMKVIRTQEGWCK